LLRNISLQEKENFPPYSFSQLKIRLRQVVVDRNTPIIFFLDISKENSVLSGMDRHRKKDSCSSDSLTGTS
jgi:hypothetical protein